MDFAADAVGESMKSLFLTKASAGGAGSQIEDLSLEESFRPEPSADPRRVKYQCGLGCPGRQEGSPREGGRLAGMPERRPEGRRAVAARTAHRPLNSRWTL